MVDEHSKAALAVLESVAKLVKDTECLEALVKSGVMREQVSGAMEWSLYLIRERLQS